MAGNALYELYPIADDSRYDGFAFVRPESRRGKAALASDFLPDREEVQTRGRAWRAPRLASVWTPEPVVGRVRSFNDYPTVDLTVPAFSRRAVDLLRDFLEPNGELLPLASSVGEYHAYNVLTVADILDPQRSHLEALPQRDVYECLPERMIGLSIFRLVEKYTGTYVAQPFVDRVRQHGLQGFHFAKLWPLPPGVNWFEEDKKQWRQEEQAETPRGRAPVKGNAVVVCIALGDEKPTDEERQRTKKLLDELDAMLHDPAAPLDARLFGSLEGDEFIDGESRLFVSCPDADALVKKLRPWLKRLSRDVPLRVLKRYGEYVDGDAPGEWVKL